MRLMTSKDSFNTKNPDFCDYKTGIPETGKRFTVTNLIFERQWWTHVHVSYKYIKVRPKSSRKIRRIKRGRARKKVEQKNMSKSTLDPQGTYRGERGINKGEIDGSRLWRAPLWNSWFGFLFCFDWNNLSNQSATDQSALLKWSGPLGHLIYCWREFRLVRSVWEAI